MKTIQSVRTQISALLLLLGLTQPGFAALVDMAEYQDWDGVEASIFRGYQCYSSRWHERIILGRLS
jgi:hypothetical protein